MLRKTILNLLPLSALIAVLCAAAAAQSPSSAAHVLDVRGDWRIEGSSGSVKAGDGLPAGAKIDAVSDHPGDAITIVRDDDMARQHVACDSSAQNPCRAPLVIAAGNADAGSALGRVKGMVQAALAVLLSNPPEISSHYATTLSRGADSVRELEGVSALDQGNSVVLPAPPEDMLAGTYTLSIVRTGATPARTEQKVLLTSEGMWRPITLQAPGLYQITVRDSDDEKVADLMVLVVSADSYPAAEQNFQAAKTHASRWTGPNARSDAHLFLRAFLLAESRS